MGKVLEATQDAVMLVATPASSIEVVDDSSYSGGVFFEAVVAREVSAHDHHDHMQCLSMSLSPSLSSPSSFPFITIIVVVVVVCPVSKATTANC